MNKVARLLDQGVDIQCKDWVRNGRIKSLKPGDGIKYCHKMFTLRSKVDITVHHLTCFHSCIYCLKKNSIQNTRQ